MDTVIGFLNTIFWGYVLIYGLLAVGIFFTLRLGFVQIVHFTEMFRVITGATQTDKAGISPFQALTVSLASRVGTGNIAGVATVIVGLVSLLMFGIKVGLAVIKLAERACS